MSYAMTAAPNHQMQKRAWEAARKSRQEVRQFERDLKRHSHLIVDPLSEQTLRECKKFSRRAKRYEWPASGLDFRAFDERIQQRWDARRLARGTAQATGDIKTRRL